MGSQARVEISTINTSSKGLTILRHLPVTEKSLAAAQLPTGHSIWKIKSLGKSLCLVYLGRTRVYIYLTERTRVYLDTSSQLTSRRFQDAFLKCFLACESLAANSRKASARSTDWALGWALHTPPLCLLWMFARLTSVSLTLQKGALILLRVWWRLNIFIYVKHPVRCMACCRHAVSQ